ncbi:MAG: hypothetical protein E6H38_01310 [Betaproteobacteria bacterium]|nr:MAG: hypothetical protein E6H38_01310 [Betaproteobacteria bacterium]
MSRFFIHRPVFAGVIAIVIVLAGLVAAKLLAVAQYPEIAPPTVLITTTYPGASAETLAKTVAAPIEEQLSGVERLSYFSSSSSSNGSLSITVTFEPSVRATASNTIGTALGASCTALTGTAARAAAFCCASPRVQPDAANSTKSAIAMRFMTCLQRQRRAGSSRRCVRCATPRPRRRWRCRRGAARARAPRAC